MYGFSTSHNNPEELSTTLFFSFPNPGHDVRLEFGETDIERFELSPNQGDLGTEEIASLWVVTNGRSDSDSTSTPYCFLEPVLLVAADDNAEPRVLLQAGECMNISSSSWKDPSLD